MRISRADDSSIAIMVAVMFTPPIWFTVLQRRFWSSTAHIIHPDWSWSWSKKSAFHSMHTLSTSQLSTHHSSIIPVPAITTHRSPLSVMKNLHSPNTTTPTIRQPHTVCTTESEGGQEKERRWEKRESEREWKRVSLKKDLATKSMLCVRWPDQIYPLSCFFIWPINKMH